MDKAAIIKILGTDKCPTCKNDLLFDVEIKNSLVPKFDDKKKRIDPNHPFTHVESKADVCSCWYQIRLLY